MKSSIELLAKLVNVEPGDKVKITWVDGLVNEGTFVREERGYHVFLDENEERFACLPNHVKNMEIISGSRRSSQV